LLSARARKVDLVLVVLVLVAPAAVVVQVRAVDTVVAQAAVAAKASY
jgi:hypothetical protein